MYLFIIFLFHLIFFLNYGIVRAENYYISNSGNDRNEGLSPVYPWRSIEKLNSFMPNLKPGDAVYFERGGYFTGQINLTSSGNERFPLTIGAYGKGNNPVISAAIPIKGWTLYKDNIYKAEVNFEVKNLFVNGKQMTIARYPNTGMLTISKTLPDPHRGFTDKSLNQQDGYWNGSTVRVRSINWAYEYSTIKNFSKGTFIFSDKTVFPLQTGWGYYLDNKLSILDTAGEWFFKKTEKGKGILYFKPEPNQDINKVIAEACIYDYAIFSKLNLNNLVIKDIDIKFQFENGIWFTGLKDNIQISNCRFIGQFQIGINFSNISRNCKINNCRFYGINGKAIYILESFKTIISNNIFTNTGMVAGYGTTGDAFGMSGIVILNSDSNHLFKNLLVNTGHDGINSIGNNNVLEKNILFNSMLLLNDGSAIKCYGDNSSYSTWRYNFIFNSPGNLEGTNKTYNHVAASGIYLDDKTNNLKVYGNTITGCGLSGINLNNGCSANRIYDNICFGNAVGLNFYQGADEMKNNNINDNIFLGRNDYQYFIQLITRNANFHPGKFFNNYFVNPNSEDLFIIENKSKKNLLSFSQWKNEINPAMENNSVLLTGKNFMHPKILMNMTEDSSNVLLEPEFSFKDISGNSLFGSTKLPPWSTEILFADKNTDDSPEIYLINGPLYFGNIKREATQGKLWFGVIGENIKEYVSVTAPEGFKISKNEEGPFYENVNLIPGSGKVFTVLFVKFDPEEEKNYYNFIKISSGKVGKSVKVTGSSR